MGAVTFVDCIFVLNGLNVLYVVLVLVSWECRRNHSSFTLDL